MESFESQGNSPWFLLVYYVTIIFHQFHLNVTIISHHSNRVMRVCGLLTSKKVKKVRDNYLTSTGWGCCAYRIVCRGRGMSVDLG